MNLPVLNSSVKGLVPGLTERGKIKIGMKGQLKKSAQGTEFRQPVKLDHFIITTLERDQTDNFIIDSGIHKILGDTPGLDSLRDIPIYLMYDKITLNFRTQYSCYKGKTRMCYGDGEKCIRVVDDKGTLAEKPCPCEKLEREYPGKNKCKINGVLSVVIQGAENVGGVWKLRTTSWNTCQGIYSSLVLIHSFTKGRLMGLDLHLTLSPKTGTDPAGATQKLYVVGIEYRGTPQKLMEESYDKLLTNTTMAKRFEQVEEEAKRLLCAEFPNAEDEDYIQEFAPEQVETGAAVPPPITTQTPPTEPTEKKAGKAGRPPRKAGSPVETPPQAPEPEPETEPEISQDALDVDPNQDPVDENDAPPPDEEDDFFKSM